MSIKQEFLALPTSHKNAALTIQRAILCILPILKTQEKKSVKDPQTYTELKKITLEFCSLMEESQYPLSIKVNS